MSGPVPGSDEQNLPAQDKGGGLSAAKRLGTRRVEGAEVSAAKGLAGMARACGGDAVSVLGEASH